MSRSGKQFLDRAGKAGGGSRLQRLRLVSGLVLLAYVVLHYINHAAGHISLGAMEKMLEWQEAVWANPVGLVALYGALLVHVTLGLAKLPSIRSWRRPVWEWLQIALGLAIPWLLISHITYTRGADWKLGIEVDYAGELGLLWPGAWIGQSILLLIVWLHAVIGIHFWLRIRDGYRRWFPLALAFAIALPVLAQTGWMAAARRQHDAIMIAANAGSPVGEEMLQEKRDFMARMIDGMYSTELLWRDIALAIIVVMLAVMVTRWVLQRFARRVRVTYGDGTVVNAPMDQTLLDISRANAIPHMSVCGGRARCSTCRTLIIEGLENCSPVTEAEKLLLDKLNADEDIRLACQCRIRGDVQVRPLIQPRARTASPRNVDPLGWGVEREVAIMFLDIRGFSRISEKSLPYDVVFILNSVFGEIGTEIEAANGYIDKFMGDGLMAIFGLSSSPGEASRDAIRAALASEAAARASSKILTHHLSEPIRIGIGIDTGTAVIGRIGRTSDQVAPSRLTAIGDTVNIAARLESATKELGTPIVLSKRTMDAAGLRLAARIAEKTKISVHNITQPVDIVAIRDLEALRTKIDAAEDKPHRPGPTGPTRFLPFSAKFGGGGWTNAKKSG
ncbi:MAG: 2Fe-2S iron-sulfur cluster binding domain-containing protein [Nitratireductor sp.]|nr:2Fe-2S iron-sulfur cluster binding domain-containing protein [Nitratireductor sp.]